MKISSIYLFCAIIIYSGFTSISANTSEFEKISQECLDEVGLDPSALSRAQLSKAIDEGNCYLACIDKKRGLMKQDGTYDEEIVLSVTKSPDEREARKIRFDEVTKICNEQVGNDYCKLAVCVRNQWKKWQH